MSANFAVSSAISCFAFSSSCMPSPMLRRDSAKALLVLRSLACCSSSPILRLSLRTSFKATSSLFLASRALFFCPFSSVCSLQPNLALCFHGKAYTRLATWTGTIILISHLPDVRDIRQAEHTAQVSVTLPASAYLMDLLARSRLSLESLETSCSSSKIRFAVRSRLVWAFGIRLPCSSGWCCITNARFAASSVRWTWAVNLHAQWFIFLTPCACLKFVSC